MCSGVNPRRDCPGSTTAQLGWAVPPLQQWGEALAGFAFLEHPETQVPPRARLRSREHPALCGEKPVLVVGGPA